MKKHTIPSLLLSAALIFGCAQEVIELKDPTTPEEITPDAGTADFTKYVAIGTSISAGFQAGALFTDGQNESVGAILAEQFATVNGNAAFNQPSIESVNGFNSSFSNIGAGVIRGRLILFDPDGPTGPRSAGPAASGAIESTNACTGVVTPAVPAPYNTANPPGAYAGVKTTLNNLSVPGIVLAQILTPATGGPASSNPAFNPYYQRFATSPSPDGTSGSSILTDALAKAPTFFTFELGYNDVLGYATTGGVGTIAITPGATFNGYLTTAMGAILGSNANLKGAIANVPDVTKLPFFSLVAWNSIVLPDQATIDATNAAYAAYNGGLDAALAGNFPGLTAAEVAKRKIQFTTGKNGIVILDETLTDLTPVSAGLVKMRMATIEDKITLGAGAILGTRADCLNPSSVYGVGVALADQYVLIPSEITAIRDAVAAYNTAIATLVNDNSTKLALADLHAAYETLVTEGSIIVDGALLTPSISPPGAAISEDAVHPNGRGAAYFANVFIEAINEKFDAAIPKAKVNTYKGTRLPVSP